MLKQIAKVSAIAIALGTVSLGAQASLITSVQHQQFEGSAGSSSGNTGISPFIFDGFDSSLGDLLNVWVSFSAYIDNGEIGADNLTNGVVDGTAILGATITFSPDPNTPFLTSSFTPVFQPIDITHNINFTLAADPTMSTGGAADNMFLFEGYRKDSLSPYQPLASFLNENFLDTMLPNGQFQVDFNTTSSVLIDASGVQGTFKTVDVGLAMNIYYEYELPAQEVAEVPEPSAIALLGIGLLGFAGLRKKIRVTQ
jgi:hypothetical protein